MLAARNNRSHTKTINNVNSPSTIYAAYLAASQENINIKIKMTLGWDHTCNYGGLSGQMARLARLEGEGIKYNQQKEYQGALQRLC